MNDVQRRRALILEVADRLLRHYGLQKTTIADVAREAGVGVGTVYLEFPSKDVLVEEIARARHRAVLDAMCAAAAVEGVTAGERLAGVIDARLDAFLALIAEGAHACDLVRCKTGEGGGAGAGASAAVKSAQASYHEEELALVAELLRRGAMAGELDVDDPEACARTVLRAYATFSTGIWMTASGGAGGRVPGRSEGGDGGEVKRAQAAMHHLVLRGLITRKDGGRGAKGAKGGKKTGR